MAALAHSPGPGPWLVGCYDASPAPAPLGQGLLLGFDSVAVQSCSGLVVGLAGVLRAGLGFVGFAGIHLGSENCGCC